MKLRVVSPGCPAAIVSACGAASTALPLKDIASRDGVPHANQLKPD